MTQDNNIILLANQPRLLREMLHRAIDRSSTFRYVLEVDKASDLIGTLDHIHAKWLVVSLDDGIPQQMLQLIEDEHPALYVLGVSIDGGYAEVLQAPQEQARRRYELDHVSLLDLLNIFQSPPA